MKIIRFCALLLVLATFVSCSERTSFTLFAMDTLIDVSVSGLRASGKSGCKSLVSGLENKFSATITDSDVSRFNASDESAAVSDETARLVQIACEISDLTAGAYDITVRPLVSLWNIAHAPDGWKPPSDAEIVPLLFKVGYDRLTVGGDAGNYSLVKESPLEIDLGGIGKGYAAGALAAYLAGVSKWGTLSFGGNVATVGTKPDGDFVVGVKNPLAPETLIGTLAIPSGIVAVSGGYERYVDYDGVRYHHILDPVTGSPSDSDLASAAVWVSSVSAESGAVADALSTAFFVMGSEKSLELLASGRLGDFGYEIGAVFVLADGSVLTTDNLSERFTK